MTKKNVKQMMLVLMILVIGLYFISGTYARYASAATGSASAAVAKWAVKVNTVDITQSDSLTLNFEEVENDNVVDGKIAPASELKSQLVIDPTDSEVAMDYIITLGDIKDADGNDMSDKIAISRVEIGEDVILAEDIAVDANGKKEVRGTIELASQTAALTADSSETVIVYVEWEDKGDEDPTNADNVSDTELGLAAPTVTMEIKATALQHVDQGGE